MKTKVKTLQPIYITLEDRTNQDLSYWLKITEPEQRFIDALERFGSDLPLPVCEYRFNMPFKHRADFAWPALRWLVEVDGGTRLKHGGRHNTDADREKINQAEILGFHALRFSTDMLKNDPAHCIDVVRLALGCSKSVLQ